jgi:hypothetical protein
MNDSAGKVNTELRELLVVIHNDSQETELNLTLTGLQNVMFQKTELFIATAVRTSNSTRVKPMESENDQ